MATVHLNKHQVVLVLARKKTSIAALARNHNINAHSIYDAIRRGTCTPKVAGKLAQFLDVDVSVIVEADR